MLHCTCHACARCCTLLGQWPADHAEGGCCALMVDSIFSKYAAAGWRSNESSTHSGTEFYRQQRRQLWERILVMYQPPCRLHRYAARVRVAESWVCCHGEARRGGTAVFLSPQSYGLLQR